jgi:hypothetical protein
MSQLHKIAVPKGTPSGTAIFVHGLGGDAFDTWRARPEDEAFWPHWLAEDIPGLAVFSVGYPAAVSNWRGTSMPLQDRAGDVLEGLLVDLEQLHAPIVFVCHSLGGLVVSQRHAARPPRGCRSSQESARRRVYGDPTYRLGTTLYSRSARDCSMLDHKSLGKGLPADP